MSFDKININAIYKRSGFNIKYKIAAFYFPGYSKKYNSSTLSNGSVRVIDINSDHKYDNGTVVSLDDFLTKFTVLEMIHLFAYKHKSGLVEWRSLEVKQTKDLKRFPEADKKIEV